MMVLDRQDRMRDFKLWRGVATLFAPWLVVICIAAILGYHQLVSSPLEPLKDQRERALEQVSRLVLPQMSTVERDALYLARHPLARALADHPTSQELRLSVESLFASFSTASPQYAQLRWIDAEGYERVRCDQSDRRVVCLPTESLQNKADRYYFRQSILLGDGDVFLSDIDLNVEHWAIEVPYVPMIRAASPIIGADGDVAGVLVINVKAREMLSGINSIAQVFSVPLLAVNGFGQWVIGERPGDAWAHLLGASGNTFATRYPHSWQAMVSAPGTWIFDDNGAWLARSIPLSQDKKAETAGAAGDHGRKLVVISRINPDTLRSIEQTALVEVGLAVVLAACYGLWVAWRLSLAYLQRANAVVEAERRSAQLGEANKLLSQTLYNLQSMQDDLVRAERLSSLSIIMVGLAEQLGEPLSLTARTLDTLKDTLSRYKATLREAKVEATASVPPLYEEPGEGDPGQNQSDESGGRRGADLPADGATVQVLEYLTYFQNGLSVAAENTKRSLNLLDAFQQLASDRSDCDRRQFVMQDLLREVLQAVSEQLRKNHIVVELNCPESVTLDSFPGPLAQAIEHLLRNVCAHAYGPAGGPVYISVRQSRAVMTVVIEDTGAGIPEDILESIVGALSEGGRAPIAMPVKYGGIGLYLVYRFITETLGGRLNIKSVVGLGSRFIIEIPVAVQAGQVAKKASPGANSDLAALPDDSSLRQPTSLF